MNEVVADAYAPKQGCCYICRSAKEVYGKNVRFTQTCRQKQGRKEVL
jgi:hypothetical protein